MTKSKRKTKKHGHSSEFCPRQHDYNIKEIKIQLVLKCIAVSQNLNLNTTKMYFYFITLSPKLIQF